MNKQGLSALTVAAMLPLSRGTNTQNNAGAADMDAALDTTEMHWHPAPPHLPAGIRIVVLQGDPGKAGFIATTRLRFPAGAVVCPHLHSIDEATVISGMFQVMDGDVLDKNRDSPLTARGFNTLRAGHQAPWVHRRSPGR